MKRLILTALCTLLLARQGWATDYYITESGSGTNGGLTYANSDSLATFNAGASPYDALDGDTVYLCDTIRGHVIIPDGGADATTNLVTIRGDYADHAGVILGSLVMDETGDWTSEPDNQWHCTGSAGADDVFDDYPGIVMFGSESQAHAGVLCANEADVNADYEYWYDATEDRIVVYATSNPYTYYGNIEIGNDITGGGNEALIDFNNKDYVTITALTLKYFAAHGIRVRAGSDHVTVSNCNISYGGGGWTGSDRYGNGIDFVYNTNNCTASNNTISQVWDWGIHLGELWDLGDTGFTIEDNVATGNAISLCGGGLCVAMQGNDGGINIIDDNIATGNTITSIGSGWAGEGSSSGVGIFVTGNATGGDPTDVSILSNIVNGTTGDGILITRVVNSTIYGNSVQNVGDIGIRPSAGANNIYYNIIANNPSHGINVESSGGTNIYNNTFYNNGTVTGSSFSLRIPTTARNVVAKNNIFYHAQADANRCLSCSTTCDASNSADYNLYDTTNANALSWNGTDATHLCTEAEITAGTCFTDVGQEQHGVAADPLFVTAGSNFHLQSGSPAIDAGTNVSLTSDFDGRLVPRGIAPDIGAYEYYSAARGGCFYQILNSDIIY